MPLPPGRRSSRSADRGHQQRSGETRAVEADSREEKEEEERKGGEEKKRWRGLFGV